MPTPPNQKIEIGFGSSYTTALASVSWTDASTWGELNEAITITHGRDSEQATTSPGTCGLTLDNTTGRFTPGLASGAYYPNVKVATPIRVSAYNGSAWVPRFTGYVDQWPVSWPGSTESFAAARVTASSRMAWLGKAGPLSNVVREQFKLDGAALHYQLDGLSESTGNGVPLLRTGTGTAVTFDGIGAPTDGLGAAQFGSVGQTLEARLDQPLLAVSVTATFTDWLSIDIGGITLSTITSPFEGFHVSGTSSNLISQAWDDGLTHTVHVVDAVAGFKVYLDGALIYTGGGSLAVVADTLVQIDPSTPSTCAHVAAFTTALTLPQVTDQHRALSDGWAGESAADRLERYAGWVGVAAADVSSTVTTPVAHIDSTGRAPVDLMRVLETTCGGVLYDSPTGVLTLGNRTDRYVTTAAFTISVTDRELADGEWLFDDSQIVNQITVTYSDGTATNSLPPTLAAADDASVGTYGPRTVDLSMATSDVGEAHGAAWWRINTHADPSTRLPRATVRLTELDGTPTPATVLAAGIGSMIAISGWPAQAPASTSYHCIEGWTETLAVGIHDITWNLSDAADSGGGQAVGGPVWTVEDAVFGQYDAYPLAY